MKMEIPLLPLEFMEMIRDLAEIKNKRTRRRGVREEWKANTVDMDMHDEELGKNIRNLVLEISELYGIEAALAFTLLDEAQEELMRCSASAFELKK